MPMFGMAVVFYFKTLIMSDNKNNRGGRDRERISLGQDYEVRYWSKRLGVSKEQLKEAVQQVGDSVHDVENYLKREI
jgi:hypothetical protein